MCKAKKDLRLQIGANFRLLATLENSGLSSLCGELEAKIGRVGALARPECLIPFYTQHYIAAVYRAQTIMDGILGEHHLSTDAAVGRECL